MRVANMVLVVNIVHVVNMVQVVNKVHVVNMVPAVNHLRYHVTLFGIRYGTKSKNTVVL